MALINVQIITMVIRVKDKSWICNWATQEWQKLDSSTWSLILTESIKLVKEKGLLVIAMVVFISTLVRITWLKLVSRYSLNHMWAGVDCCQFPDPWNSQSYGGCNPARVWCCPVWGNSQGFDRRANAGWQDQQKQSWKCCHPTMCESIVWVLNSFIEKCPNRIDSTKSTNTTYACVEPMHVHRDIFRPDAK